MKSNPPGITDILYFQQNTSFGLTERYLSDLACGIDRCRYNVHLVFPDVPELRAFKHLSNNDVCLHYLPTRISEGSTARQLSWFLHMFRKLKPDLIHFNDPAVVGLLAGRLQRNAALVITHHTPELNRQYGWCGKWLERFAFGGCPFVIFTSESDLRTGVESDGIQEEYSTVIPYGIDAAAFGSRHDRLRTRQELGIPAGHRIVGNVSRLDEQKGHVYLIEAAKTVLSHDNNVTFVIVGDGPLRDKLIATAQRAGIVGHFVFTGHRSDVARLLSAFDVFVMPSLFEGLCMAVLEALATAVPVVAAHVGGIPSSVVESVTGKLVPPGAANALAEGILWMLQHPEEAREMGLRGRRRIENQFTIESMLAGTEAVYNRILSRREIKAGLV